ncbi:MAG TPA: hypothetical protein DCM05_02325 [Elusimicrobia bacterium]|nr:hypothetical protein [Elusimicrobiota bacterium]
MTLLVFASAPAGSETYSPEGYPGSTWGSLKRGSDDTEGTGVQGWARQGVRWVRFKGDVDMDTYAAYNWRVRNKNKTYYNTYGPSLIASLAKGPLTAGAEFAWLRYPDLPLDDNNYSLFGSWFSSWDVSKWTGKPRLGSRAPLALPLSTWGKMTYDLHGEEGSGSQGWVRQGVDWAALGWGWMFHTYASYDWRLRSKNRQYYDVHGPSLAAVFKGKYFDVGSEYCWETYPQLHRTVKTLRFSLSWFYGWDLKDLKTK